MFFLLFVLNILNVYSMPSESMTVIGNRYENIYIMTPTVKQDGKEIRVYNYEPLIMSVMTLFQGLIFFPNIFILFTCNTKLDRDGNTILSKFSFSNNS